MINESLLEMVKQNVHILMEAEGLWAAHIGHIDAIVRIMEITSYRDGEGLFVIYLVSGTDTKAVPLTDLCANLDSAKARMVELQEAARERVAKMTDEPTA